MNANTPLIIHRFNISIWFSFLFAISFSAAAFGVYGAGSGFLVFILGLVCSWTTLQIAFKHRAVKNALKSSADSIAVVGMVFFLLGIFQAGLIVGLLCLLFFLQLALNLNFREYRQVYFGVVLCFVALMSGAVQTFSSGYIVYMVLFCTFASFYIADSYVDKKISLQVIANIAKKKQKNDKVIDDSADDTNADKDAVNQALKTFGEWSLVRRMLLVVSICALAAMIYLLIPRFPAGNIGGTNLKGWGHYTQQEPQLLEEDVELSPPPPQKDSQTNNSYYNNQNTHEAGGTNNPANQDEDIGLSPPQSQKDNQTNNSYDNNQNTRESDDTNSPADQEEADYLWDKEIYLYVQSSKPRYLQSQTKTYFDGRSWHAWQNEYKQVKEINRIFELYPQKANDKIDIKVKKDLPIHVLGTANTTAINFPAETIGRDYYDGLKASDRLKQDTYYQLLIKEDYYKNRLIDYHQSQPSEHDLQLPELIDPRIQALAEKLTADYQNDWDKAMRLEQHMRSQYAYTLDTLANQNNIPVSDFLFNDKRGHCEYFATSLTLMLRSIGIRSRMVTGFVANDYNPVTGYYEVKGINGHAWVQAYLNDGWVTLEGTGAYPPPLEKTDQEPPSTHEELKEYLENLEEHEARLEKQPMTLIDFTRLVVYMLLTLLETVWHWLGILMPYIAGIIVLALMGYFVWRLPKVQSLWLAYNREKQNKKRLKSIIDYQPKSNQDDALFYMNSIQSLLDAYDINRYNGSTIEQFNDLLVSDHLLVESQSQRLQEYINQTFYNLDSHLDFDPKSFFIELFNSMENKLAKK